MGEVLPRSATPPPSSTSSPPSGLFLFTWMVKKAFVAMFLSYKKIRRMLPSLATDSPPAPVRNGERPYLVGYEYIWFVLGIFPLLALFKASVLLLIFLLGKEEKDLKTPNLLLLVYGVALLFVMLLVHMFVLLSVIYWYRDLPFQLMGANAKLMIEVIPVMVAATLHECFEVNEVFLCLLLSCTMYFSVYAHFFHIAYDIGLMDVLLEIVMVFLVYAVSGGLQVRASSVSFCIVLCLYKYMMYSAPQLPVHHHKQELEQLPC